jgi:hypothetical protein
MEVVEATGLEAAVFPPARPPRASFVLTVLAKNETGYATGLIARVNPVIPLTSAGRAQNVKRKT